MQRPGTFQSAKTDVSSISPFRGSANVAFPPKTVALRAPSFASSRPRVALSLKQHRQSRVALSSSFASPSFSTSLFHSHPSCSSPHSSHTRLSKTRLSVRATAIPASVTTAVQPIVDAFLLQPATWQSALLVTSTIFAVGLPGLLAGLTMPGVLSAFLLGVTGTLVTKVKLKQKQQEGIAEKRSGRRGPWSVVGSAAAAVVCCLGAIAAAGGGAGGGMEGVVLPSVAVWQLGYVASFATKLSDTAGSEIGKAFGKRTFLVTSFQPVPRGTEGAVSLEGTLAGLAAAVVLAHLSPTVDAFLLQPATWQSAVLVTSTTFAVLLPGLLTGLTVPGVLSAFLLGHTGNEVKLHQKKEEDQRDETHLLIASPSFEPLFLCSQGTLVTKVKLKQKQQEGIAEKRSGRRGPWSVVGSAAAAVVCCLGAIAAAGGRMEGVVLPSVAVWQLGYVASFATKLSDTAASEIGKAFGKRTFLVTSFQPVPRGTEGAVSLEGTLAALFCMLASQFATCMDFTAHSTLHLAFLCPIHPLACPAGADHARSRRRVTGAGGQAQGNGRRGTGWTNMLKGTLSNALPLPLPARPPTRALLSPAISPILPRAVPGPPTPPLVLHPLSVQRPPSASPSSSAPPSLHFPLPIVPLPPVVLRVSLTNLLPFLGPCRRNSLPPLPPPPPLPLPSTSLSPLSPFPQSSLASLDADFFSSLPRDLQVDLDDAVFDLTNGNVLAECGPAVSAALSALSAALTASEGARAAAAAAVAGLRDAAAKLPPGGRERAVLGRRLRAAGRRFTGMGAYAQGKAAQLGKAMAAAGEAVAAGCTDDGASNFDAVRTFKLGPLAVDVTPSKALTGAAIAAAFAVVSWQLVTGLQAVDESSLAYANDNALILALSLRGTLLVMGYGSCLLSAFAAAGLLALARDLSSQGGGEGK
ncbi:unnamed protein product [Closterium sp. Naga37s-1]|nr:unnamed protein product [Closterium sp. Naga37s-1]